jgi:CHAD domain-containing protein
MADAAWQTRQAVPLDVPTVSYALPEGLDPAGLLGYLDKRFPVIAEPGASRSYTVLDTADRRLRAAGVDLDLETDRGGPRLVLRDPGRRAPLIAEVRRPRRNRYLLRDVPAGPLRERLAPIVEMRALLPLANVQVGAQLVRVLNADDKTVARVSLATPVALVGSGDAGAVPLTPRVDVIGVLGYPTPLGRVTAAVRRGPKGGLVDAAASVADEAIAATGGDPEGIRTKVLVDLRPEQRTDRAAVAVLCDLAGMVEANLPGTLADLDTEFLHDLRVAVRRSRSVLRELKGSFPPEPLGTQRDALRWIQAVTGPTRDLDVQLLDWDHLVSAIPVERHAALAPVRALLVQHRAAAFRALRRELRGPAYRQAWDGYRAFLAGDLEPARDRPDAKRRIVEVAGGRIRKVYRRMLVMGAAIDAASPATHLHELRKRGKELRYLLELFGGLWPRAVVKPMVRSLKELQDMLGVHQDREVQAAYLRGLAGELATSSGGPAALLALGVLVDRLDAEQREARDAFAARLAAFGAADQQALVAKVFS